MEPRVPDKHALFLFVFTGDVKGMRDGESAIWKSSSLSAGQIFAHLKRSLT